jgi:hypothetical protein
MTRAARWIPVAMSIVTLELTPAEFAELHQLSDRQLRKRFALPRDCDPVLMAVGGHGSRIAVVIACEPERPPVGSDF